MKLSYEDLVARLKDEKDRSIGFDDDGNSSDLHDDRERALRYFKGDMFDLPSMPNRSKAVDTTVADSIEQILPLVTEIFTDEDVFAFTPMNALDIDQAEQETDVVNYVIFQQNNGFEIIRDLLKDAFINKNGYLVWHWEEGKPNFQTFRNKDQMFYENVMAAAADQIVQDQTKQNELGLWDITLQEPREGRVCIKNWPPEDVAVSEDTGSQIGTGTYCAFRTRMRRQELRTMDYDQDIVDVIPAYDGTGSAMDMARDTVGESQSFGEAIGEESDTVEITYHYIRMLEGDEVKLFYVVTGGDNCEHVLDVEEVERVNACSVTPFPIPHRHFGQSVADKLVEVQRTKTVLLRSALDQASYALLQRLVVAEEGAGDTTVEDILNNQPGAPIRVEKVGAVTPLQQGQPNYDPFMALEYMAVQAEQRSGSVRATMGLTPDTLHDSASGAMSQMNNSQIRVRFIGRNIAEQLRPLWEGTHSTLRANASIGMMVRLRGKFIPINPADWVSRTELSVEIGNAGGRDHDVAMFGQVMMAHEKAVQAQQGLDGPLTNPKFMLQSQKRMLQAMGLKNTEMYFPEAQEQQPQPPQDPMQSPEALKVKAELDHKMAVEQMKSQERTQIANMKLQAEYGFRSQREQAIQAAKAQVEATKSQIEIMKLQAQIAQRDGQTAQEIDLKARMALMEDDLKRMELDMIERVRVYEIERKAQIADLEQSFSPNIGEVYVGGYPG